MPRLPDPPSMQNGCRLRPKAGARERDQYGPSAGTCAGIAWHPGGMNSGCRAGYAVRRCQQYGGRGRGGARGRAKGWSVSAIHSLRDDLLKIGPEMAAARQVHSRSMPPMRFRGEDERRYRLLPLLIGKRRSASCINLLGRSPAFLRRALRTVKSLGGYGSRLVSLWVRPRRLRRRHRPGHRGWLCRHGPRE